MSNVKIYWVLSLIVLMALFRLIPHEPNFTPLGAMALLGGICFKDLRLALLLPFSAMLLSDFFLGFHTSLPAVYLAFFASVLTGRLIADKATFFKVAGGAFLSAVLFYLITNFAAWLQHDMYSHSVAGLIDAYVAGIPFFRNTLISTVLFSMIGYFCIRGILRMSSNRVSHA